MGAVTDNVTWAAAKAVCRAYCGIDGTSFDAVLEELFDASVLVADEYLNNPFEELRPAIVVSGVVAGDNVSIGLGTVNVPQNTQHAERFYSAGSDLSLSLRGGGALLYTAAAGKDEDALEFAIGADNSETADNLAELINSGTLGGSYGAVGVPGVKAANVTGTITLTRRYPEVRDIYVASSDEDTLMVRQVRTSLDIPKPIYQWIYQRIYRHFKNPGAVIQETLTGKGTKMWLGLKSEEAGMIDNYDTIRQWRIPVGL